MIYFRLMGNEIEKELEIMTRAIFCILHEGNHSALKKASRSTK